MQEGRKSSDWPGLPSATRRALALGIPLGLFGAAGVSLALWFPLWLDAWLLRNPDLLSTFVAEGLPGLVNVLAIFTGFCGVAWFVGFAATFLRRPWALSVVRKSYLCYLAWVLLLTYVATEITGVIHQRDLPVDNIKPDAVAVFFWRWELLWRAFAGLVVAALGYLYAWRRAVIAVYAPSDDDSPAPGDEIVENIRTHGRDPQYRQSLLSSFSLHIIVIVLLPMLFQLIGCVDPYLVPKGSGEAQVTVVKVVKQQQKKKKKRYLVNPHSSILFSVPDLDDALLAEAVEEATQLTYQADANRVVGAMGAGGGKRGGWPDGMDNAVVRFIRLEYNGPGWDDGMDAVSRADRNFLDEFKRVTGFKVANQSESHPIALLRKYKPGFAPPFVYMTGSGAINVSANDLKILREYLLDGGMLFADCASPEWDRQFRSFVQALFPGESLLTIADDDPIFQFPYSFQNGAPPLWHHGGRRAQGIKYKGRWVVFYHPGDIHDAWKTGHSGLASGLAQGAFEMGINVVYYSFTHYLEETRKYRK